jgi:hypothetical protein
MKGSETAMIPYDIDPSLHDSELPLESLEDGFSPPPQHEPPGMLPAPRPEPDAVLGDKSPF